jgi:hypothetical protein
MKEIHKFVAMDAPGRLEFARTEDVKYSRIFGGVSWPAARAGFVVIVGEHRTEFVLGKPKLVVLDQASDLRLYQLVEKTAALRFFYRPERFMADCRHVAAMQFVAQFAGHGDREGLRLDHSLLCAMDQPMAYALPVLDRMIDLKRLIIPGASPLAGEILTVPAHEDPGKLVLADYPGLAALAFAVIELEQTRPDADTPPSTGDVWPERILR